MPPPRLALAAALCSSVLLGLAPWAAAAAPSRPPAPARHVVWSIGDPWGRPSAEDGQNPAGPAFSGAPPRCVPEGGAAQCSGGSGAVRFHVQRASTRPERAAGYRNMMVLQKWNAEHSYAFNYQLVPGGIYDVRFRTVNGLKDDARYVQSLIWQNHAGDGSVMTALGVDNPDGRGNRFFFNAGGHEGGSADPFPWHGPARQGGVDDWEIQFRNAQDARGWIHLYRNGRLELRYRGPVVRTTRYDLMSFGIYYYDWKIARSRVLSADITFASFELATIPGPLPPARR
jgi:hypothetical protein